MKYLFFIITALLLSAVSGLAQETDKNTEQTLPPLAPDTRPPKQDAPKSPPGLNPDIDALKTPPKGGKDLTVRSEADRKKMLDELFVRLKGAGTEEDAKLVAEEIWAVWLQSGSASVDFLLHRGIAAQNAGNLKLARRMYNHVLRLAPNYPEGWVRSGRLAAQEEDMNRAVNDIMHGLSLEPRHFYALWTLGNLLEQLGREDDAFEVYAQALKLYPKHKQIKARVDYLREKVKGKAL